MQFRFALALTVALSSSALANPTLVRETDPLPPEQERAALKVPAGFEVQLFAAEPMINKPINLACDSRGRIWVSSTVEYPYAAKKERWSDPQGTRVRDSRDAIKILEDTDGDGRADKVTDFADGLNIPTGVLPWHKPEHKDGCIAWSIPNIWYFADTDGDGQCDHREVLFGPLGWERDTHGMCSSFRLGPDAWVYATHGFNNTSRLEARDGSVVEMHSGNVFRFRPDASRVEIWSRGQVNPFGLAFDRRGNLYSADCHSAPVYQLLHGAVYPSFGKPHDGIGFGPVMIEHTHGSTGICGIAYIGRDVWGPEWNDHLLIGNPVTSRVNHDIIEFAGSTPRAIEQPDFITSDDPWFRPVDLCLGDDGALYVADFYNRIIGHYEVPLDHPGRDRERGRIWRIVKKDGAHPRMPMQLPELSQNPVADLASESSFLRRAAASALQFSPQPDALAPLLNLLESTPAADTHLRHVVRMALREHLKLPGAFATDDASRIPADLALAVSTEEASAFLLAALKPPSPSTVKLRPEILAHIAHHGSTETLDQTITLERHRPKISPIGQIRTIGSLVAGLEERGEPAAHPELLSWAQDIAPAILDEVADGAWTAVPHPDSPTSASPWGVQQRECNDGATANVVSSLPKSGAAVEQLTGVLRSSPFPAPAKLSFWLCGHRGAPDQPAHDKNLVRLVHAESDKLLRSAFPPRNDVAQRIEWTLDDLAGQPVRLELVDGDNGNAYAWLAIGRIDPPLVTVEAFDNSAARTEALRLLATLLKVTAPVDLRDRLRPFLLPSPAPPPLEVTKEERARLDALVADRSAAFSNATPNPANGKQLFTTHCAACHQVAGEGALLGPQLDGIGKRGVARLCEDILDPNRNVDAHFYLTTFTMNDGTAAAGFVRTETDHLVHLVDAAGNSHRLQKSAIKDRNTTAMSLMPPAFDQALTEPQFNDLLAWLLAQ